MEAALARLLDERDEDDCWPFRECGCPTWVERCSHFKGLIVALGYKRGWMLHHYESCSLRHSITANMRLEEWALYHAVKWAPCNGCGAPDLIAVEPSQYLVQANYYTNETEANAAFDAAVEEMLRGGAQ